MVDTQPYLAKCVSNVRACHELEEDTYRIQVGIWVLAFKPVADGHDVDWCHDGKVLVNDVSSEMSET